MRRVIAFGFLALALVAIGAFLAIDRIAEAAIEKGATSALGVPTSVGWVHVGLLSGQLEIDGLRVANPSGYRTAHFLSLDDGYVRVALPRLLHHEVIVPELTLEGIDLNLEARGTSTNVQALLANLRRGAPSSSRGSTGSGVRRFVIQKLVIRGVRAHLRPLAQAGRLLETTIAIPEIRLANVGGNRGVALRELTGVVVNALLRAVATRGGALPAEIASGLRQALSGLPRVDVQIPSNAKEVERRVLEGVGGAQGAGSLKNAGEAAGKALEGLKGVVGGSEPTKKEPEKSR